MLRPCNYTVLLIWRQTPKLFITVYWNWNIVLLFKAQKKKINKYTLLNDSHNDRHRNHTNRIYSQGFQQFFKVVDWHISESTGHIFFVCAPRHLLSAEDGSYQGGSGGMLPQEIFKLKHLKKCCFQHFWNPRISFPGKAGVHSNSEKWWVTIIIIIKQISV